MRKIAFWRTIGDAFGFAFHLGRFFRIGWIWIIAAFLADVAVIGAATGGMLETKGSVFLVQFFLASLIFSPFAVAWHRAILLGEGQGGWAMPRFGGRELAYFGLAVSLMLLAYAPFAPAFILARANNVAGDNPWLVQVGILGLLGVAAFVVVGFMVSRFVLCLPAIALGRRLAFAESWRRMKGNTWRFVFGTIVVTFPIAVVDGFIRGFIGAFVRALTGSVSVTTQVFLMGIEVLFAAFNVAVGVGFLSFTYRRLADDGGDGPVAMPPMSPDLPSQAT